MATCPEGLRFRDDTAHLGRDHYLGLKRLWLHALPTAYLEKCHFITCLAYVPAK